MRARLAVPVLSLMAVALAGCGSSPKEPPPPPPDSLVRSFGLVDANGNRVGTVELSTFGGTGRLLDPSGREIGRIVPP